MKRFLYNMMLVLCSCALALAIGEVVARLVLVAPQHVRVRTDTSLAKRLADEASTPKTFSVRHHPEHGGMYVDTEVGRRLRANTKVFIQNHNLNHASVEITTNSLGYRNPELGAKTKPRILFLGDSVTFGDWLPEEKTFVRLTETVAEKHGCRWETVNAAVGGADLYSELAVLKETGLTVNPDVVVLAFYLNDFQESPGVRLPSFVPWLDKSWLLYHSVRAISFQLARHDVGTENIDVMEGLAVRNWRKRFEKDFPCVEGDYKTSPAAFNCLILRSFWDWGGSWSPGAWKWMRPLFHEFKELAVERGFSPLVVAFPVVYQVEANFLYDYPQQQLKQICEENGIPVLDLLPILRKARGEGSEPIFYDHCHHTANGNRLIATHIVAALKGISTVARACSRD